MLASLTSDSSGEPASKKTMRDSRAGPKKALLDWTKNAITRYVSACVIFYLLSCRVYLIIYYWLFTVIPSSKSVSIMVCRQRNETD